MKYDRPQPEKKANANDTVTQWINEAVKALEAGESPTYEVIMVGKFLLIQELRNLAKKEDPVTPELIHNFIQKNWDAIEIAKIKPPDLPKNFTALPRFDEVMPRLIARLESPLNTYLSIWEHTPEMPAMSNFPKINATVISALYQWAAEHPISKKSEAQNPRRKPKSE